MGVLKNVCRWYIASAEVYIQVKLKFSLFVKLNSNYNYTSAVVQNVQIFLVALAVSRCLSLNNMRLRGPVDC